MRRNTTVGLVIGVILGLVVAFSSFGQMLIVAVFILVGWLIAKVVDAGGDLGSLLSGRRDRR